MAISNQFASTRNLCRCRRLVSGSCNDWRIVVLPRNRRRREQRARCGSVSLRRPVPSSAFAETKMARSVRHSDLVQIKRATTALIACVVQTMSESDRTAQSRFLARLEKTYLHFRDDPQFGDSLHAVEMLSAVRQFLTSTVSGHEKQLVEK